MPHQRRILVHVINHQLSTVLPRRSFGSAGRHGEDDLHNADADDDDDASGLENMDHKMVASILRGLADAADNWQHTEL